jgi:hypothetical protein
MNLSMPENATISSSQRSVSCRVRPRIEELR